MAPGSITNYSSSSSSSSSSSTAGPAEPPEYGKPAGRNSNRVMVTRCHPTVLRMVLEALQAGEQRWGTSVAAIKLYILHKYPTVDVTCFKYLLKQALATGMSRGLLARPINSKARGATGSFKLVPKHQKKPQCSRKSTRTGPAGSSKKKIAEPCEARASRKQGKALETAPQGGCKAKGTGPQQVVAKKDPPKSAGASSTVHKLGRKPKVSGSRAGKKTGAPGKTSTAASKAGKCAASLKGTKPAVKAAPGPGPKVIAAPKAATASKAGAPRTRTLSPARKAGGPKNPRPLVKRS